MARVPLTLPGLRPRKARSPVLPRQAPAPQPSRARATEPARSFVNPQPAPNPSRVDTPRTAEVSPTQIPAPRQTVPTRRSSPYEQRRGVPQPTPRRGETPAEGGLHGFVRRNPGTVAVGVGLAAFAGGSLLTDRRPIYPGGGGGGGPDIGSDDGPTYVDLPGGFGGELGEGLGGFFENLGAGLGGAANQAGPALGIGVLLLMGAVALREYRKAQRAKPSKS